MNKTMYPPAQRCATCIFVPSLLLLPERLPILQLFQEITVKTEVKFENLPSLGLSGSDFPSHEKIVRNGKTDNGGGN
jgi:hypothetical protein